MDNNEIFVSQNEFAKLLGEKLGKKSPISPATMRVYRKKPGFPSHSANPLKRIAYLRADVIKYLSIFPTAQKDAIS